MQVFTRRASEEVVIDKPARVIVLKTAPDKVKFGLLDRGEDVRRTSSAPGRPTRKRVPGRPTRKRVKIIAPYGEEIEIDG